MTPEVSPRLIDQRIRNQIMDVLDLLADGNQGVRCVGASNFFEYFYDLLPHRDEDRQNSWRTNSAISNAEWLAIGAVQTLLDNACDDTAPNFTDEELIASGWPSRLRPVAIKALSLMRARGRFSDELEQETPSGHE